MEKPIIELRGLTKCYGSLKAVDNLDLTIQKGEIFGLLGPNGAGKTTTIMMMLGLTEPTAGTATVCGYNATTNPIAVKRKVGYLPDSVGFYDSMTALENLTYIGRLNGIPEAEVKDRAFEVMTAIGLRDAADKKTSAFSRGMKQRLGLADVLIKQPEVIILDEPTLGIDPSGVKEFLKLIRQLSRQHGITVLLSSHHLHQVQQVCDRVGIFVGGKMLVEGSVDKLSRSLFKNETNVVSISLAEAVPTPWEFEDDLHRLERVQRVAVTDNVVEISCLSDITPSLVRFFVHKGLDVTGVHKKEYGLDDIYEKYFENNLAESNTNEKPNRVFQKSFFKK
ncbi:ABC-2 type transport system ATP-binding protein [Dyadobacter jejuensis]|uniref:ABC-2 type transport system ATP-binding protein n=1 Tax=Dyadobacter jejuensis TaxID=1082580 RepID=A0A316ABB6_9BACT|nr:ABC transporter ATP-binding protein [Dyadobacter jejuensis]PWJ54719.1 ABC-2 type transport system ATP-binding protein [Dyadobacter jejuensis]